MDYIFYFGINNGDGYGYCFSEELPERHINISATCCSNTVDTILNLLSAALMEVKPTKLTVHYLEELTVDMEKVKEKLHTAVPIDYYVAESISTVAVSECIRCKKLVTLKGKY